MATAFLTVVVLHSSIRGDTTVFSTAQRRFDIAASHAVLLATGRLYEAAKHHCRLRFHHLGIMFTRILLEPLLRQSLMLTVDLASTNRASRALLAWCFCCQESPGSC